jgi:hypothetical protein
LPVQRQLEFPAEGKARKVIVSGPNLMVPGFNDCASMGGTVPSDAAFSSLPFNSTAVLKRSGDESV